MLYFYAYTTCGSLIQRGRTSEGDSYRRRRGEPIPEDHRQGSAGTASRTRFELSTIERPLALPSPVGPAKLSLPRQPRTPSCLPSLPPSSNRTFSHPARPPFFMEPPVRFCNERRSQTFFNSAFGRRASGRLGGRGGFKKRKEKGQLVSHLILSLPSLAPTPRRPLHPPHQRRATSPNRNV